MIDGATIANFGTGTFENVSLATLDTTPLLNKGTIEFLGQNLLGVLGGEAIVIANDGELRFSSAAEVVLLGGLTNSAGSTFRVIDGDVAVVGDISMGGSAEIASGSRLELVAGPDGSVVNVPASGNITGEGLLDVTGNFILDGSVVVTEFDLFLGLRSRAVIP